MDWKALSKTGKKKFGTYGEYYAKMEFASYGLDVYTSEVDDHGIDFVVKGAHGFYEIQVKSIQLSTGYVYMTKKHFSSDNPHLYLCLLLFQQGRLPDLYLIPSAAWRRETPLLRCHSYDKPGLKSKPEYGLNLSKKNLPLLEDYAFPKIIPQL